MNENYGLTLREIRNQKGYTLQELADGICSVSFLSKFERNESEITLGLFKQLLKRLAVSFDEFFHLHNNHEDYFEKFFDRVNECYLNQDLVELEKMKQAELKEWERSGSRISRCNKIAIERIIDLLKYEYPSTKDDDIQFLYDYLFNVEVWGKYELYLYNLTMHLLPQEMVVNLTRTAYKKSSRYIGMKRGVNVVASVLLNTLIYLTSIPNQNVHPYAEEFLSYLNELDLGDSDIYEKTSREVIRGFYKLKTGDLKEGEKIIRDVISFYKSIGSTQLAKKDETYLEFYLEHI
ncbi:helix-turn-helix domain-containing protein [Aquisalibacillus elongatus]|uniref:Rgg/GadR/MutR family transcriptional activator n=1 Tax=Aquisalibacillus elongatus TaxID=485577 RepID=A0A3N5BT46_9BACI|nr:Rgg/GadR/MutR family transcriptional regulator [Aquisalibacillus elongatus]RPF50672.1 Rgg/GadR/MutR family transcriptional activator [Aquisalibacillus elongatus]